MLIITRCPFEEKTKLPIVLSIATLQQEKAFKSRVFPAPWPHIYERNLPRRNSIPLCAYLFFYCSKQQHCSVFGIIASAILHGTEVGAASSFCFCCLSPLAVYFYGLICISFLLLPCAAGMMPFAASAPSPPSCCFPSGIS